MTLNVSHIDDHQLLRYLPSDGNGNGVDDRYYNLGAFDD